MDLYLPFDTYIYIDYSYLIVMISLTVMAVLINLFMHFNRNNKELIGINKNLIIIEKIMYVIAGFVFLFMIDGFYI